MAIGESRTELLQWLNSTLSLHYAKVEQCGTGAAYCQIMDSIHGDVPMGKVKFDYPLREYDARQNMKILQAAFNRHRLSKPIEVERLIKCRLQDNLELLQWFKRYWAEQGGRDYDAEARRASGGGGLGSLGGSANISANTSASASSRTSRSASETRRVSDTGSGTDPARLGRVSLGGRPNLGGRTTAGRARRVVSASAAGDPPTETDQASRETARAREEAAELRIQAESLETERNFYFNKLREIEILTQNIQDTGPDPEVAALMDQVQVILYSTEKGFEVHDGDAESF